MQLIHAAAALLSATAFAQAPTIGVFATNLDNPRGIRVIGEDRVIVAEAGTGGANSTIGICPQLPFPLGPLSGGRTGRAVEVKHNSRKVLAEGLASAKTSDITGNDIFGTTDVEVLNGETYILVAAGCSKGDQTFPTAVVRATNRGNGHTGYELVADLSQYFLANLPAVPPPDFDPHGNPFSMTVLNGKLYVMEANHGEILRIESDGSVTRIVDFSAAVGDVVPTALAAGPDGNLYVGSFSLFPYFAGSANIYRVTPAGAVTTVASGLTNVTAIRFDCAGAMYVLESSTGNNGTPPFLFPGTGRISKHTPGGFVTVASGINLPTGMDIGRGGEFFVTDTTYQQGTAAGRGRILKIDAGLGNQACKN